MQSNHKLLAVNSANVRNRYPNERQLEIRNWKKLLEAPGIEMTETISIEIMKWIQLKWLLAGEVMEYKLQWRQSNGDGGR